MEEERRPRAAGGGQALLFHHLGDKSSTDSQLIFNAAQTSSPLLRSARQGEELTGEESNTNRLALKSDKKDGPINNNAGSRSSEAY